MKVSWDTFRTASQSVDRQQSHRQDIVAMNFRHLFFAAVLATARASPMDDLGNLASMMSQSPQSPNPPPPPPPPPAPAPQQVHIDNVQQVATGPLGGGLVPAWARPSALLQTIVDRIRGDSSASCTGPNGALGVCLTRLNCITRDGSILSPTSCRDANRVCCALPTKAPPVVTCGGTITANNTLFKNPDFPGAFRRGGTCSVEVIFRREVCQLRLDFQHFNIAGPRAAGPRAGLCDDDVFTVATGIGSVPHPPLCGYNNGQHMYIDVSEATRAVLTFRIGGDVSVSRKWSIKVSTVHCLSPVRAPDSCLQYYTSDAGEFQSFNFRPSAVHQQLIAGHKYSICFKRQLGLCQITYMPSDEDSFQVGPRVVPSAGARACENAYLYMPSGSKKAFMEEVTTDRFCGHGLFGDVVTSDVSPFMVSVVTSRPPGTDSGVGPIMDFFPFGRSLDDILENATVSSHEDSQDAENTTQALSDRFLQGLLAQLQSGGAKTEAPAEAEPTPAPQRIDVYLHPVTNIYADSLPTTMSAIIVSTPAQNREHEEVSANITEGRTMHESAPIQIVVQPVQTDDGKFILKPVESSNDRPVEVQMEPLEVARPVEVVLHTVPHPVHPSAAVVEEHPVSAEKPPHGTKVQPVQLVQPVPVQPLPVQQVPHDTVLVVLQPAQSQGQPPASPAQQPIRVQLHPAKPLEGPLVVQPVQAAAGQPQFVLQQVGTVGGQPQFVLKPLGSPQGQPEIVQPVPDTASAVLIEVPLETRMGDSAFGNTTDASVALDNDFSFNDTADPQDRSSDEPSVRQAQSQPSGPMSGTLVTVIEQPDPSSLDAVLQETEPAPVQDFDPRNPYFGGFKIRYMMNYCN